MVRYIKKLTQSGSHTMKSILMSHVKIIKNPQNVSRKYFFINFDDYIVSIYFFVNLVQLFECRRVAH